MALALSAAIPAAALAEGGGAGAAGVATISGTTEYHGPQPGAVRAAATVRPESWDASCVCTNRAAGPYVIPDVPVDHLYWIRAYCDANANGCCDAWEPQGRYKGNPVNLATNVSRIHIALSDPDEDWDRIPDYMEAPLLGIKPAVTTIEELLPEEDFDGDGVSNLEEFRRGTEMNDAASVPLRIGFASAEQVVSESGTSVTCSFGVVLSAPAGSGIVTARVAVVGETAARGADYVFAQTNRFALTGSQTSAQFRVIVLCDTNTRALEPEEYVVFGLAEVGGRAVAGASKSHVLRIRDYVEDRDADGLADWWEYAHHTNLTSVCATNDVDRDGWTERQEYIRGGDPHRPPIPDTNDVLKLRLITPVAR